MKKLFYLLLCLPAGAFAQTTATNFTKSDCNTGASHNLFSELDSNYVVIMEFVMIPSCTPCIDAYHYMEPVVNSYSTSHPGRLKVYQIAYNNAYTCSSMNSWASANSMTSTRFIQGGQEVTYYGGMGMPTVVVASTAAHTVFGKWIGFFESDTASFRQAIDSALFTIENDVNEIDAKGKIQIYPSPASDIVRINTSEISGDIESVRVLDLTGKMIFNHSASGKAIYEINVAPFSEGMYFIEVATRNGHHFTEKFQVSRQ